jgi:hypothetical protein
MILPILLCYFTGMIINIISTASILRTLQHGKQTYLYVTQSVLSNIIRPLGIKHFQKSFRNYWLLWGIMLNIRASLLTTCTLDKIRFSILKAKCFLSYLQKQLNVNIFYIFEV